MYNKANKNWTTDKMERQQIYPGGRGELVSSTSSDDPYHSDVTIIEARDFPEFRKLGWRSCWSLEVCKLTLRDCWQFKPFLIGYTPGYYMQFMRRVLRSAPIHEYDVPAHGPSLSSHRSSANKARYSLTLFKRPLLVTRHEIPNLRNVLICGQPNIRKHTAFLFFTQM